MTCEKALVGPTLPNAPISCIFSFHEEEDEKGEAADSSRVRISFHKKNPEDREVSGPR